MTTISCNFMYRVICTSCGWLGSRYTFQEELARLNPETAAYADELLQRKNARQARQRALAAGSVANTQEHADAEPDDVRKS